MLRIVCSTVLLTVLCAAHLKAQEGFDEPYINNYPSDSYDADISTDWDLFSIPLEGSGGIVNNLLRYNFNFIGYDRRGVPSFAEGVYFGNVRLNGLIEGREDYDLASLARRYASATHASPLTADRYLSHGGGDAREIITNSPADISPGHRVAIFAGDRKGGNGVRVQSAGNPGKKIAYLVGASRNWGRDGQVSGVFAENNSLYAAFEYQPADRHTLIINFMGKYGVNGGRSYVVAEAFELTGDNLYNPAWGYYDGQKRNSRVSKTLRPFISAFYRFTAGNTLLDVTAAYRGGWNSYSRLAYYNSRSPYPDYYRYLPGYSTNSAAAEIIHDNWTSGDPSTVQIDWERLVAANGTIPEGIAYLLEERITKTSDVNLIFNGHTRFTDLSLFYGLSHRRQIDHNFKKVKDMLGGVPFTDTDPFSGTLSNMLDNGKKSKGDRIGYDYRFSGGRNEIFAGGVYSTPRISAGGRIELSRTSYRREGLYHNELFSRVSLGKSQTIRFDDYNVRLNFRYSPHPRHHIAGKATFATFAPSAGRLFLSPEISNITVGSPVSSKYNAAHLSYNLITAVVSVDITGYWFSVADETNLYRYWDDITGRYSDMSVTGISKRNLGGEIGISVNLSPRVSWSSAATFTGSLFTSDATVDIFSDNTGEKHVAGAKSYLDGFKTGSAPEFTFTSEIRYNGHGWLSTLNFSYAGGRYVEATALRRMERAYNLTTSPEQFQQFVSQEKLPDAFTVNLMVLKSFRVGKGRLTPMFSINNLLGKKDIIYNAYEQMRVGRKYSANTYVWNPFPTKYLYGYGRTYYISVNYSF